MIVAPNFTGMIEAAAPFIAGALIFALFMLVVFNGGPPRNRRF